jgi:membrane-associated phospholipid phosphatase
MRGGSRALAVAAVLAAAATSASPCAADERLRWKDEWGHAQPTEYAVAVTFGVFTLIAHFMPVAEADWERVGFDEGARDVLRFGASQAREASRAVSDAMFYGLIAYPVVDALVALPRDREVGWQMLVVDLETLALAGFTAVLLEHTTGRERPYARYCSRPGGPAPEHRDDCHVSAPKEEHKSFPSGHALMSFAGAGLICAHHLRVPIYGGGAPDQIACGVAAGAAGVQGLLRVTGDRHFVSDVVVGGAIGFAMGYGLPMALRYSRPREREVGSVASGPGALSVPLFTRSF